MDPDLSAGSIGRLRDMEYHQNDRRLPFPLLGRDRRALHLFHVQAHDTSD